MSTRSPTKIFIIVASWLGLATQLKTFPDNEIRRGQYAMKLKAVSREANEIKWPKDSNHLPVLTWDDCELPARHARLLPLHLADHIVTYSRG